MHMACSRKSANTHSILNCLRVVCYCHRKFRFLPAIMVTVIVAKWVGDWLTHGLYHELLHVKHIPFLADAVPKKMLFRVFGEVLLEFVLF